MHPGEESGSADRLAAAYPGAGCTGNMAVGIVGVAVEDTEGASHAPEPGLRMFADVEDGGLVGGA
jgi:hypothetical protein